MAGCILAVCSGVVPAAASTPAQLLHNYTVQEDDTFVDVARTFDLGYVELVAANPGVDPWLPKVGRVLSIPDVHLPPEAKPARGIVVNLGDLRLYYYESASGMAMSFPIGIGQEGWDIPLGHTAIIRKRANPTWVPPASIRAERPDLPAAIPPGPDNPMGAFALDLGWPSYAIHGTNRPYAVGRRVTHGCIRLYPEDIARLFRKVPVGLPVTVIEQPAKFAWLDGELYMEAHPGPAQVDELEQEGKLTSEPLAGLDSLIQKAARRRLDRIDWAVVQEVVSARSGIPTRITRPEPLEMAREATPGRAPAAPSTTPDAAAGEPVSVGPWQLWLGSARSAEELTLLADNLKRQSADLLSPLTLTQRKVGGDKGQVPYYRLYARSLPSLSAASELCGKLKRRNADLVCVPFLLPDAAP
ncbi:MAG TPA: L,D-transpeptidase family protein [Bradyrhizobium sp.]|nr:L,D-transpeptidase family protein [Bradyrhizobium sp.]